jgi:hypothetical protein
MTARRSSSIFAASSHGYGRPSPCNIPSFYQILEKKNCFVFVD